MLEQWRKQIGEMVFNRWKPPEFEGKFLRRHSLDYGHAYLYDPIFGRDLSSLPKVVELARAHPGSVLDFAGGTGHVSSRLVGTLGCPVLLLDQSEAMLSEAKNHIKKLSEDLQGRLSLEQIDLRDTDRYPEGPFSLVLCLRNGLEHLGNLDVIRASLLALKARMSENALLVIETHFLPYWQEQSGWMQRCWKYSDDVSTGRHRYRVWERTSAGEGLGAVIWEHAILQGFRSYILSHSELWIYSTACWKAQFSRVGLEVLETWGDWTGRSLSRELPRQIFVLKDREK